MQSNQLKTSKTQFLLGCIFCLLFNNLQAQDKTIVNINTANVKWTISDYLVGMHSVYSFEPDAFYADGSYASWMKTTGINTMRYPGGTVVKYWDWENPTGDLKLDSWDPKWNPKKQKKPEEWFGLDEYIAVVKQSGITPLLGVNITSGYQFNRVEESIERAVKMVKHVKDAGLGGAFWYLGNEGKNGGLESEAKLFVQHAKAMKAVDPEIKCMFNQNHLTPSYLKKYLAIAGDYIDIVETHGKWPYGGAPKGYEPGTYEEWQVESPLRDRKNSNRVWRDQIPLLQKAAEEAGYPNIKFANNEYGIGKGPNVLGFDRYSKSLLVIDMLQEFFIGNWYMACYWSQLRSSSEESVRSSARENYRFNAMRFGFELLAKAQGGAMLEMTHLKGNQSVYGFAAKKGDEYLVYILNKSDNNQELVLNFNNKQKLVFVDGKSMVNTQDKFGKMISTAIDSNDQKNSFQSKLHPMSYTRFTFKTK